MASHHNKPSGVQSNIISLNKTFSVSKRRNPKTYDTKVPFKESQDVKTSTNLTSTINHTSDDENSNKQAIVNSQSSNQSFSSRNSLRTSQSFATKETNFNPPTMPLMADYYQNESIQLSRDFETDLSYQKLNINSDCFNLVINGNKICMLCRRKHGTAGDHARMFLELRNSLLDKCPHRDSIQMHTIKNLLLKWYDKSYLVDYLIKQRLDIVQDFNAILCAINPECGTRLVGSLMNGTSTPFSNINLELIHPNSKLFETDMRAKNSIHHTLINDDAELGAQVNNHTIHYDLIPNPMDTLYKLWTRVNETAPNNPFRVISKISDLYANLPKLTLMHQETGIELEVNCCAQSSLKLVTLLRTYLSLDQRSRIISILVKFWAECCKINKPDRGTLPPYVFVILVIHFLQRTSPPVLPFLHDIIQKEAQKARESKPDDSIVKNVKQDSQNAPDNIQNVNKHVAKEFQSSIRKESGVEVNEDDEADLDEDAEEEEDDIHIDENNETLRKLNWSSSNNTPIHELFIEFLRFMSHELECNQRPINIRSMKRGPSKHCNTQIKVIENPIKPSMNLARCIGNHQNFQYILHCFRHSFYYLTSLPVDMHLKPVDKHRNNPEDYVKLYYNADHLQECLENLGNTQWQKLKDEETLAILTQENTSVFSRDVEVVDAIFDKIHSVTSVDILDTLTDFLTKCYNKTFLRPKDSEKSMLFCWLCKSTGHSKSECPMGKIAKLHHEFAAYDFRLDFEASLDTFFITNYQMNRITEKDSFMYKKVVEELNQMINSSTGLNCHLELYGSTANNLGSYNSDLDICMTILGNPSGRGVDCVDALKKVYNKVLTKRHNIIYNVEPVFSARVPIIKFKYSKNQRTFDIDLSMYNQCATYNSKLLKMYSLIDERLPQLFYLVKRYAKACQIADASKGTLSSYAWSIMVIHYLQHTNPPILPVLQETEAKKPIVGINGWNVWFNDDLESVLEQKAENFLSLTQLFKGFFLYYGTFDFEVHIVSIRKFSPISRFQKNWNNCLMAIEDPFELTYNLASRLDDPMAIYIMNSFAQTYIHVKKVQESYYISKNGSNIIREIFDGFAITKSSKPPFRGCRVCNKIGHRVKDCPESRQGNFRRRPRTNGNNNP